MKNDSEKIIIFLVGIYLLMQDNLENKNNYVVFKSTYIERQNKSDIDYMFEYYISNPQRWKRKMKNFIRMLSNDKLMLIFNEIMDIYHKIIKM